MIDREALRDIPLGYLISLLKGEAHHRNIRSAGLWHRLWGGQRLSMGDYVRGLGATTGANGAGAF